MHEKTKERAKMPGRKTTEVNCPRYSKVKESKPSTVSREPLSPANGRKDPLGRDSNVIMVL
jgi:hypothetical protein